MLKDLKENINTMKMKIQDIRRTKCNYKAEKYNIWNKKIK